MRTKVLICAAVLAASLASSMAQNVYSLNVVGYYNVTANPAAYTILANQFTNGNNSIKTVLPSVSEGTKVWTYVNDVWVVDIFVGGEWYDNGAPEPTLSTTKLNPGRGFFFDSVDSTPTVVTFVGEVPQGTSLTVPIGSNLTLGSTFTPQELAYTVANGFPQQDGMLHYTLGSDGIYKTAIQIGGDWYDNGAPEPTLMPVIPKVGTGWFIDRSGDPANKDWVRNFTVQ